jgi:branched-chain amino acid transport system permease protein
VTGAMRATVGRWTERHASPWPWVLGLVAWFLPAWWGGAQGLGLLTQVGIALIACLSYHLLLGEGGLLSFGHAVHTGLGAFATIHALQWLSQGNGSIPVALLPLLGGAVGLASAVLVGLLAIRRGGTAFAMITLGLGELVYALALMLPGWSGGEAGITGNRVRPDPWLGLNLASPWQLYGLVSVYALVSGLAIRAYTRTPVGLLLRATRDNPERVEFLGASVWRVRLSAYAFSGWLAGMSGGLGALYFEVVTAEVLGAARSGALLMFTVLGGVGALYGPVIGAVLMVLASVWLSALTQAWMFYLGGVFLLVAVWAPGGCVGLLASAARLTRQHGLGPMFGALLALVSTGITLALGGAALIEMAYHLQLDASLGPRLRFLGIELDSGSPGSWAGAVFVTLTGAGLLAFARRHLVPGGGGQGAHLPTGLAREERR